MGSRVKRFILPGALLILALIVFGVFIPRLGFYWDDLPYVFFGHVFGLDHYQQIFYDERPFLPILYNLTAPVLGENIVAWQVFAILMRWACALVLGWIVQLTWPEQKTKALVVAILFLVYPGFGQQWISTIYSRVFILLLLFLLSLALMQYARFNPRKRWVATIFALVSSTISLLGSEYFFGLELVRPAFLWIAEKEPMTIRQKVKKVLSAWLPYLVIVLAFAVWRILLVKSSLYDVEVSTGSGNFSLVVSLIWSMLRNGTLGGLVAWINPVTLAWFNHNSIPVIALMLAAGLAATGFSLFIYARSGTGKMGSEGQVPSNRHTNLEMIIAGALMLLAGSLPVWAAGLTVDLIFPGNRFTLSMMAGSALLLAGCIDLLRSVRARMAVLGVLVFLASAWQVQLADNFRTDWYKLESFLDQLTWRMPGLQPDTMLVAYELPFDFYSDNSLTAAVNWTYAPELNSTELPYILNYLAVRGNSVLQDLSPDTSVSQKYRNMEFTGNLDNLVAIYKPADGCLRILDSEFSGNEVIEEHSPGMNRVIKRSNLTRIIPAPAEPAVPPAGFHFRENTGGWCYYFQKIDLANQTGNFAEAVGLWREAQQAGFKPANVSEYYPVIESLALTGNLVEAGDITVTVQGQRPSLHDGLCRIWGRIDTGHIATSEDKAFITQQIGLVCK